MAIIMANGEEKVSGKYHEEWNRMMDRIDEFESELTELMKSGVPAMVSKSPEVISVLGKWLAEIYVDGDMLMVEKLRWEAWVKVFCVCDDELNLYYRDGYDGRARFEMLSEDAIEYLHQEYARDEGVDEDDVDYDEFEKAMEIFVFEREDFPEDINYVCFQVNWTNETDMFM